MKPRREAMRAATGRSRWTAHLLAAFLAVVAVLVAYANALDNPFVYDDYNTVVANPSLAEPVNPVFVLVHSPFRPVVNASYALDRIVWGYWPLGFHLTSLALHVAVVLLLYLLIVRALRDSRRTRSAPSGGDVGERDIWVACFAATAFAVHPMMTESAGYISGRSELLCGVFFLASLLCGRSAMWWYNRRADPRLGEPRNGHPWLAIAGSLVFGMLALLSKEVAVALPVVLLAYDWLVLPGPGRIRRRRVEAVFIPACAFILTAAGFRLQQLMASGAESVAAPHLSVLTQAIVIWRYVIMLIVPTGQSIMHSVRYVTSVLDPVALAAVLGLAAVTWGACRVRRAVPLVTFGVIWFFAALAPSSSVVSLREGMAEHRVYFAAAGLTTAFAGAATYFFERGGRRRTASALYPSLAAALIVGLSSMTVARNDVWDDPVELWQEAVERAPQMWEPWYAHGDALRSAGDCAAALPSYQRVIRLRPAHRDAYTNLGICLAETGRPEGAANAFQRALEIDPQFARGYTNLGGLAIRMGDYARARDMYHAAIEIDRGNVFARLQLARLYEEVFRDYHAAARMCGEARALAPFTRGVVECVERNQRLAAGLEDR